MAITVISTVPSGSLVLSSNNAYIYHEGLVNAKPAASLSTGTMGYDFLPTGRTLITEMPLFIHQLDQTRAPDVQRRVS